MLTDHQKLIKKLTRDHNATIKRLEAARDICSVGTNSYRQYEESIAAERRKHTEQLVSFGIIPADLGKATQDHFVYISHMQTMPTNEAELQQALGTQLRKACKDLNLSPADEEIRAQLQQEFR